MQKVKTIKGRRALLYSALVGSAAVLAQTILLRPAVADSPPAASIHYETWRGGVAFMRMRGLHTVGGLATGGLKGRLETWSSSDGRMRREVDLGAFKQKEAVVGDTGWSTTLGGQPRSLSPSERLDAIRDAESLYDGVLHGAFGAILTSRHAEPLDGQPRDVFRISYSAGGTFDYFIAPADGRLVALRSFVQGKTTITRFTDWRSVSGVQVAFREDLTGETPGGASSTDLTGAVIDPNMPASLFDAPASISPVTFVDGASSSGWLPFEFFGGTRIFIPAVINGHPANVMLDSGASATVIDRHFASSLGLRTQGDMTGQGEGGSTAFSLVHGVNLNIGDLSIIGGAAVAIDMTAVARQVGHDLPVILGGEVFRDTVVDIDFQHRRIAFRDPTKYQAPPHAHAVAATASGENEAIVALVEGRPARLLFDLGNASALSLFPQFWDRQSFMAGRRTSTTMIGGAGGMGVGRLAMISGLTIGGSELTQLPVALESSQSSVDARSGQLDGNIGIRVMDRFHLIVDFPHERVLFALPADLKTPFDVNHTGLTLQPGASGSKVLYVAANSPAATAGLQAGDVIIAVNDVSESANGTGARSWLSSPVGKVLRLRLESRQVRTLTAAVYF